LVLPVHAGVRLAIEDWQPLLEDPEGMCCCSQSSPLAARKGWKLLGADADPNSAEQAALDDPAPLVIAINRYWPRR
jgi:hypothetical protein